MTKKKISKIYEALLEGAQQGLADRELHDHVMEKCPKATSRKIVRASLLALSDPDVREHDTLNTIYALAIKHRLDGGPDEDIHDDEETTVA